MARKAKDLLNFEPVEGMTYCTRTKHVATVAGLPYPLFVLIISQSIVVSVFWGFVTFLAVTIGELLVWYKLKKYKVPVTKLPLYLKERRSSVRRALPLRKQKSWRASSADC